MDLSRGRQGLVDSLMPIVSPSTKMDVVGGSGSPTRTTATRLDNMVNAITIGDDDCVIAGENTDRHVSKVYQKLIPCMGTSREFVSHTISAACKGIAKQNTVETAGTNNEDSEHFSNQHQTKPTVEKENPVFVKDCLEEMNKKLAQELGHPPYSWSNLSIFYNQSYLDDRDFKLMFLRAELLGQRQHPDKQQEKTIGMAAADRYVKFLEFKLDLFGWDKLTRAIVQADLDQEDIIALESGLVEIVNVNKPRSAVLKRRRSTGSVSNNPLKPQHEQQQEQAAGDACSAIVLVRPHLSEKIRSIENAHRALFYLFFTFLKTHLSAQQNGLVGIMYHSNIDHQGVNQNGIDIVSILSKLQQILPWRFSSFHFCVNTNPVLKYDNALSRPMAVLSTAVMKHYFRMPFQCHIGTNMECMYELISSGIPQEALTGNPDTFVEKQSRHLEWLHQLREQERELACTLMVPIDEQEEESNSSSEFGAEDPCSFGRRSSSGRVQQLQPMDVLLGARGRGDFRDHEGNLQFQHMVKQQTDHYMKAEPLEKMDLADDIVQQVRQNSGRFLKQDHNFGCWRELDDEVAAAQVSDSFRARHEKQRQQQRREARNRKRRNQEGSRWAILQSLQ